MYTTASPAIDGRMTEGNINYMETGERKPPQSEVEGKKEKSGLMIGSLVKKHDDERVFYLDDIEPDGTAKIIYTNRAGNTDHSRTPISSLTLVREPEENGMNLKKRVVSGKENANYLGQHTVEKAGERIVYEETRQELDTTKQAEMGIKSIRKKYVTEAPIDFWKKYWKYPELYLSLTEGEFPSFSTWTHAMWGDGGIDRDRVAGREAWQKFLDDGEYFQKISSNTEQVRGSSMMKKYSDTHEVFNLATLQGISMWRDSEDCPVFVFGSRNKAFIEYVRALLDDLSARSLLLKNGWIDKPTLTVGPAINPTDAPAAQSREQKGRFVDAERATQGQKVHLLTAENKILSYDERTHHLDNLKYLIEGVPILHELSEPLIPVINHPGVQPLRWCQADIEMATNDAGQLEITFFETD